MPLAMAKAPRSAAQSKRDKRERIAEAAWELFSEHGFEATTTKAIAERAGVATGTLFLYARDKDDLLCLVMHERLDAAIDLAFETVPQKAPFVDRMLHIFGTFLDVYQRNPAVAQPFVRALLNPHGPNGQKVSALTFGFLHRLSYSIREAQVAGEVHPSVEPLVAAQNLFSLYSAALMGWASGFVSLELAREPGLRLAFSLQFQGLHA
jgi:TetR/AcrR family transcriptional regulator, cholesterol catabolism regulator